MDIFKWIQNAATDNQSPQNNTLTASRLDQHNEQTRLHRHPESSPASSILRPALLHDTALPDHSVITRGTEGIVHGYTDIPKDAGRKRSGTGYQFERRPRRKTRPDLYEPKSTEKKNPNPRKRYQSTSPHDDRKQRRKRPRKDKVRRNPADDFEARNVPVERLTVCRDLASLSCIADAGCS